MIDIDSHRIIDIIDSRNLEEVTAWLKTYKNLKIVSRDGSITYKNAIKAAHPTAIQISDRFHLLKNLTDYCKEYLKSKFNTNIIIEEKELETSKNLASDYSLSNKHLTLEKKWEKANELLSRGINKSTICKQLNMDIRIYNKLSSLNENDLEIFS